MCLQFLGCVRFLLPSGSDCLPLGEELNGAFTVEVRGAPHRFLVTGETEHWKWDRNWQINTDLSSFDLILEFSRIAT